MIMQARIEHICYECDSEFVVECVEENEMDVSFCPYCGSELDLDEDQDDMLDDEDEEDSWN